MNNIFYPLREEEQMLRQFLSDHQIGSFHEPLNYSEFEALLRRSPLWKIPEFREGISSSIKEDQFFSARADVTVFQHMRFLPPAWHQSEFFELACVLDGEFTYYLEDQVFPMKKGDITILAPNIPHCSYTADENGVQLNILVRASTFEEHFMALIPRDDLLYTFFNNALYTPGGGYCLQFITGEDMDVTKLLSGLDDEAGRNRRYKNEMLTALISVIFVTLVRNHESDIRIPGAGKSEVNERTILMLEYMQKNYATITLHHLAEFFNYSERQIQRIIVQTTGSSFKENITRLKMLHAGNFLLNTDLPIAKVAEITGYFDVSHFRKAFSSFYGVTPSEYRKPKS